MSGPSQTYVRGISPDAINRERDDFYPTPPAGARALLSVEQFTGKIWEPACGEGAISKELLAAGYEVESTDLIDRGYGTPNVDFLLDYQTVIPNIVTNPPFKLAEEFAWHALRRTTGKVALLCRLAWLEGLRRKVLFESTPLARVWIFSRRLTMVRGGDERLAGGGSMLCFAWYVWAHGHSGPPTLGFLDHQAVKVDSYDPAADALGSYNEAIAEIRRRKLESGEIPAAADLARAGVAK
jgi:hypothetical protein